MKKKVMFVLAVFSVLIAEMSAAPVTRAEAQAKAQVFMQSRGIVLKGEMSLVGTRPPTVDEWQRYEPYHRSRMSTRPGITGLWQVSGRSNIRDFDTVVRMDREYIENWSLKQDIHILFKTVWVVFRRNGTM